jgi:16S rRNA processing protein RimM
MKGKNYRQIGHLSKLHGFEGEAILVADGFFAKNIEKTEWIFLKIDGLPVPFFVLKIYIRSESLAIIKLQDISSSSGMQRFLGMDVFVEDNRKQKFSKETKNSETLKGYQIIDLNKGFIGLVEEVVNYNENYILQVNFNNKEILIPIGDEIIQQINDKDKIINVTIPEGLLDLYL